MRKVITGNYACAYGAKASNVEVIAAYPITPQTQVVEKIAEFVSNGELKAQYIEVESEHSAMAACIGASMVGARAYTATSAQGLLLMHEMLHWAANARLPIVMANTNRALAPPWSIWSDQQDSISQRDTGWLQFYCESNQEVFDTTILAYKVAEKVSLPAMLVLDAFILSHTAEPVEIIESAHDFLSPYNPKYKLDIDNPCSFGLLTKPEGPYYEFKYKAAEAMEESKRVIIEAEREFERRFGRYYGLVVPYRCENADILMVASGAIASSCREVIDKFRAEGVDIGLARIRTLRPFPSEELVKLCKDVKVLGVLDRNFSFGAEGVFCTETKSAVYNSNYHPIIKNYIIGLGGRDVLIKDLEAIVKDLIKVKKEGLDRERKWIGLIK
ncbi:MAG: pyruvate ferredoxin oxidoreductase [Candidatus Thermoplasmatota archaeon]|nr:pyruvate ferredoxin oxidoreductase [Candidatus Thermoplasmatota archaeon]